ncbi:sulfatase-like hydrolase/transferase, partial [Streptomyces albidoflavus]
PYVTSPEYFNRYKGKVDKPEIRVPYQNEHDYIAWWRKHCNIEDISDADIARARTAYFAMVTQMDDMIGRILDTLVETGLDENVMVIYSSDHGEQLGDRGLWFKQTLYDQSAKVPLLMSLPGIFPKGERRSQVVNLIDLVPTILEVAGANQLPSCDGVSFLNVARDGGSSWANATFSEYYSDGLSPWAGTEKQAHRMLRFGNWKYNYFHGYADQLFDLDSDPHELRDLINEPDYQAIAMQLRKMCLAGWDPDRLIAHMKRTANDKRSLINWSQSTHPADVFRFPLRTEINRLLPPDLE